MVMDVMQLDIVEKQFNTKDICKESCLQIRTFLQFLAIFACNLEFDT